MEKASAKTFNKLEDFKQLHIYPLRNWNLKERLLIVKYKPWGRIHILQQKL